MILWCLLVFALWVVSGNSTLIEFHDDLLCLGTYEPVCFDENESFECLPLVELTGEKRLGNFLPAFDLHGEEVVYFVMKEEDTYLKGGENEIFRVFNAAQGSFKNRILTITYYVFNESDSLKNCDLQNYVKTDLLRVATCSVIGTSFVMEDYHAMDSNFTYVSTPTVARFYYTCGFWDAEYFGGPVFLIPLIAHLIWFVVAIGVSIFLTLLLYWIVGLHLKIGKQKGALRETITEGNLKPSQNSSGSNAEESPLDVPVKRKPAFCRTLYNVFKTFCYLIVLEIKEQWVLVLSLIEILNGNRNEALYPQAYTIRRMMDLEKYLVIGFLCFIEVVKMVSLLVFVSKSLDDQFRFSLIYHSFREWFLYRSLMSFTIALYAVTWLIWFISSLAFGWYVVPQEPFEMMLGLFEQFLPCFLLLISVFQYLTFDSVGSVAFERKLKKWEKLRVFPKISVGWNVIFFNSSSFVQDVMFMIALCRRNTGIQDDTDNRGAISTFENSISYQHLPWKVIRSLTNPEIKVLQDFFLTVEEDGDLKLKRDMALYHSPLTFEWIQTVCCLSCILRKKSRKVGPETEVAGN